jgi:hypothetical protein
MLKLNTFFKSGYFCTHSSNYKSIRNMKIYLLAILCVFVISMSSCYYRKPALVEVNTVPTCDTTISTYSGTVQPILASNCSSCHFGASPSSGIRLDSYAGLSRYAANGHLVGNISHAPGYDPMPQGLPKLPDCEINKIIRWVNLGYQNN